MTQCMVECIGLCTSSKFHALLSMLATYTTLIRKQTLRVVIKWILPDSSTAKRLQLPVELELPALLAAI